MGYGIGARPNQKPQLLFFWHDVDETDGAETRRVLAGGRGLDKNENGRDGRESEIC